MTRFHLGPEAVRGERVIFDAAETHHVIRVLRSAVGDLVQAVDGRGQLLTVRLTAVSPRRAEGVIVSRTPLRTESPLDLTLAQGIPKGDKMEGIIRMVTELGVARVIPLITARTVVRVDPARWGPRLARWQRIAREAAKQSGRAAVPEIAPPRSMGTWLAEGEGGLLICLWEAAREGVGGRLPAGPCPRITVAIGPEGGWAEQELHGFRAAGAIVGGLGPRILRAETAGPVAVALLQSRYGDLGTT